MATSKMLSALIGPTLIAIAASMLLNISSLPKLIEQVAQDPALILVSGMITFVVGLAIVRVHNFWKGGWPVVVTVIGWLALLGGLARMLFPIQLTAMAAGIAHNSGFIIGESVVFLALGGFLSLKGYSRD
jgi:hypothetical protein